MSRVAVCLGVAVASVFLWTSQAWADAEPAGCGSQLKQRTANDVFQAHLAAFVAQDVAALACDYSDDSVWIVDGNVIKGRDAIVNTYAYFFSLTGAPLAATPLAVAGAPLGNRDAVIQLEYSAAAPHLTITFGSDTFMIANGKITTQTSSLFGVAPR